MQLFRSKAAQVLTLVLIVQAAGFYSLSQGESIPLTRPLEGLPEQFGPWQLSERGVIEQQVQDVLKADDLLNRTYKRAASSDRANLFIAFFRSQRTGQAPHSPKNCLPGSGWIPILDEPLTIQIPGGTGSRTVNRYIVQKGEARSMVIYWYQSRDRVVASEYWAKFYVVADALRLNRTDTALVRVVVHVAGNETDAATQNAIDFIRNFFPVLRDYLPA